MKEAAHVTMLQRTPTWYFIRPAKDGFANFLRKILPEKLAYRITRFKNVRLQDIGFRRAREKPQKVKEFLTNKLKASLGDPSAAEAFTPPYNPSEPRPCPVPHAYSSNAFKAGNTSVRP